jgi:hypothetical protein
VACHFHSTGGKYFQQRILYPIKSSFRNGREIDIFQEKQNMREYNPQNCPTRSAKGNFKKLKRF